MPARTPLTQPLLCWLPPLPEFAPIQFADKPDIPFNLAGYTDLAADDFVYFKTQGGFWVAAAEDESGRLFMIDQVGDLYYDSGDPAIGLYAVCACMGDIWGHR